MTNKNNSLFLVRLPFGQKTIPYKEVSALIATAKSPGYDCENATDHEGVMFALGVMQEEGQLKAAVRAGEVEVLNKSFHRISPPVSVAQLENALLTVQAFREYLESIHGLVEVEDAPERQQTAQATDTTPAQNTATPAPVVTKQAGSDAKPWLTHDPLDPDPAHPWYTSARYFARQLAIEKPTLLANRGLLADKVSTALYNAGIKKRGGQKKFDSATVLKAFVNVTLG